MGSRTAFIIVPCTMRDGAKFETLVHVDDIANVRPQPNKPECCIVEKRSNPDYAIWADISDYEVKQKLAHLGVDIA